MALFFNLLISLVILNASKLASGFAEDLPTD